MSSMIIAGKGKRLWEVMRRYLLCPINEHFISFLFYFLMSWCILIAGRHVGEHHDTASSLLLPLIDFYIVCLLASCLDRIRLGWLPKILFAFLLVSELFTVLFYHSCFSPYVLLLILQTDVHESTEFLSSIFTHHSFWLTIGLSVTLFALSVLIERGVAKLPKCKDCLSALVFIFVILSAVSNWGNYQKLYNVFSYQNIADCEAWENKPDQDASTSRLLFGLAFNLAMDKELDSVEHRVEESKVDSCNYRSPLIVFVIGESYNKHHAQLYNKDYPATTPRLCQLRDSGNLFTFTDAVSSYNLTSFAFRSIFSTSPSDKEDHWEQFSLFPALFKKAGYKVYFISNQFLADTQIVVDLTGGAIFNRPKLAAAQLDGRNKERREYDIEIFDEIPPLDTLLASPTLLIVHLKGQHVNYCERYTKEFNVFKPTDFKVDYGGEKGRQIVADYANATLYNDFVVDSLFKMFKHENMVGVYLADHGEEVYDWRDMFIRSNETDNPDVAHYQYEIPFMIYMSDKYKESHEDLVKQVEASLNLPFISSNVCHSFLYLAGISCSDYKDSLNILSPYYDKSVKRILRGKTDYDELMRVYNKNN